MSGHSDAVSALLWPRRGRLNRTLRCVFFAAVGHWLRRSFCIKFIHLEVKSVSKIDFAEKLMLARQTLGLSRGELTELLGYKRAAISQLENGHRPASATLILLLETLLENHRLKQEVARVRGAAAELMGAAMPYPRHTEGPATLNRTASSNAAEARKQTPAEIFEAAKQKVLAQIPQAAAPTSPKPKPAREKTPPASSGPPAKGSRP